MIGKADFTVLTASVSSLALFCASAPLEAQETRRAVITQAELEVDENRQLELLLRGLDPGLPEPRDSIWAVGVMRMAELHIFGDRPELATTWLRWAVRLDPGLQIDSVWFYDRAVFELHAARNFVGAQSIDRDALVHTEWRWASVELEGRGELRLAGQYGPSDVRVTIALLGGPDRGERVAGTVDRSRPSTSLLPGSYILRATAGVDMSAEVVREILPGVTTVVGFDLSAAVVAEERAAEERAVAAPVSTLSLDAEANALRHLGRLSVERFGTDATCAAGFFVGRDGLFLTTYRAIRGAEDIEVRLSDGRRVGTGITVAAYDTERDVAVLKLPSSVGDSLVVAPSPAANQPVWALGYPGCQAAAVAASRITTRTAVQMRLADSLVFGEQGGPLVSAGGAVVGLATSGYTGVPADRVRATLEEARRNILTSQQMRTLADVARRENHLYGSVSINADMAESVARIRPLESWHWAGLERDAPLPYTFAGPMGRYRIELLVGAQLRGGQEYTLNPGVPDALALRATVAEAAGTEQLEVRPGGRGFPWPIALLAAAGAAVGGAVLLLGGEGGPGGDNGETPVQTGGITIEWWPPQP